MNHSKFSLDTLAYKSVFQFRFLLLFSCLLVLASCQTSILPGDQEAEITSLTNYHLELDISNVNYIDADMQDTTHVTAAQDLDFPFVFRELNTLDRYLYFTLGNDLPADSIALLGSIRFVQGTATDFSEDLFDVEFVLIEALSNLEQNTDGTYNYLDRQYLANRLSNENWGHQQLFGGNSINQLLLTLPVPLVPENGWEEMVVSSNGFYFPYENLNLTEVTYLAEDDTIVLSGQFEVELKILSCGFYSFYSVRQASFRGVIK